ncbi:MAG: 5-methylcytosine-specific restriction enzyme subunit McrC [Paraglaciecola sp.]|jgi:5-methylcytosine-specific restriction enzyme subunit McrC
MIDSAKNNGTDKYGLSQADFYQMFAYGHKYLKGDGQLVLIYPKHEGFDVPIEHSFDFNHNGEANLTLWVVPFNIEHGVDDKNRLHLPADCLVQSMFESYNLI